MIRALTELPATIDRPVDGEAAAQSAWARGFVDGLREAGIADLVVSPGSRSTPLLAAALAAQLRCHPVIDERAAGFFALGMAKASGAPVAVLCTSGTAAAHLYPAVIEAACSFTPLVVITADRPPELQGCAAPQTIDQTRLYGVHARASIDLGAPDAGELPLRALHRRALQAVAIARGPVPGPVHVNVPARKPLEPVAVPPPPPHLAHPLAPPTLRADESAIAALADACAAAERGVIVAGPAPIAGRDLRPLIRTLHRITGFPVLAEATSQLRLAGIDGAGGRCDAFDVIYRPGARALEPDLVLQLGAPPTSSALGELLARARPRRWVVAAHGWPDPWSDAAVVAGDPATTLARLIHELAPLVPVARPGWAARLAAADRVVWRCVDAELARAGSPMHEGQAVRAAVAALPAGALLCLGNSLPVRLVDTWCPGTAAAVDVWSQRGANGIDGLIAGAAGAATACGRPTVLLLGDVSFAHDLGGLEVARRAGAPLAIVVLDNHGGRIFERLPVARCAPLAADLERFWLTPPEVDIPAAAAAYGIAAAIADTPAALTAALATALARPGCTVVRAPVDPSAAAQNRLHAAAGAALAHLEEP